MRLDQPARAAQRVDLHPFDVELQEIQSWQAKRIERDDRRRRAAFRARVDERDLAEVGVLPVIDVGHFHRAVDAPDTHVQQMEIVELVERDGAAERMEQRALRLERIHAAAARAQPVRDRHAHEPCIRAAVHSDRIVRQLVDHLQDRVDLVLDVRPSGLDQRLGLICAVPVDDERTVNRIDHDEIADGLIHGR